MSLAVNSVTGSKYCHWQLILSLAVNISLKTYTEFLLFELVCVVIEYQHRNMIVLRRAKQTQPRVDNNGADAVSGLDEKCKHVYGVY